MKLYRAGDFT